MEQQICQKNGLMQLWKDRGLADYVKEQIEEAGLQIENIDKHFVYLRHTVKEQSDPPIAFSITLGKGFPSTAPRVHFASSFTNPSLQSYRDFFTDIVPGGWTITARLKLVIDSIPSFLEVVRSSENLISFSQEKGRYHQGKAYSYDLLKRLSVNGTYVAFETHEDQVRMYVAVITCSHILLFRPIIQPSFVNNKLIVPKESEIDVVQVEFQAQIQSLFQVCHIRSVKNQYSFLFEGQKSPLSIGVLTKQLKITKSTHFLQTLIKTYKGLKGRIEFESGYLEGKSEEKELIREARVQEQKLKYELSRANVEDLSRSYQRLVEFYSSLCLPYQQIFLRKASLLFSRQDVKEAVEKEQSPRKDKR